MNQVFSNTQTGAKYVPDKRAMTFFANSAQTVTAGSTEKLYFAGDAQNTADWIEFDNDQIGFHVKEAGLYCVNGSIFINNDENVDFEHQTWIQLTQNSLSTRLCSQCWRVPQRGGDSGLNYQCRNISGVFYLEKDSFIEIYCFAGIADCVIRTEPTDDTNHTQLLIQKL